jgi:hypothetical protein
VTVVDATVLLDTASRDDGVVVTVTMRRREAETVVTLFGWGGQEETVVTVTGWDGDVLGVMVRVVVTT